MLLKKRKFGSVSKRCVYMVNTPALLFVVPAVDTLLGGCNCRQLSPVIILYIIDVVSLAVVSSEPQAQTLALAIAFPKACSRSLRSRRWASS